MKAYKNLFILILFIVTYNSFGQIVYDFKTDEWSSSELESQSNVKVYVDNINPFIWDIKYNQVLVTTNPLPNNVFGLLSGDFQTALSALNLGPGLEVGASFASENAPKPCIEVDIVSNLFLSFQLFQNNLIEYQNLYMTTLKPNMTYEELADASSISTSIRESYKNLKTAYTDALLSLNSYQECTKNQAFESLSKLLSTQITDTMEKKMMQLELLKNSADKLVSDAVVKKVDTNKEGKVLRLKISKFEVKGDKAKIKMTFSPRKHVDLFELPLPPRVSEKQIPIKNNFKISFSPGLIFASGLNDKKYNLSQVMVNDSITNYRIIREDESKWNYGISALTHFTWSRKYGGIGLNLGLGYLPKNTKIAGLVGGSIILGDDKQLIINGGIAASFTKVLSDAYEINERFPAVFEIKTKEQIQTGIWLGISYRL